MISYKEAIEKINQPINILGFENVSIENSDGRILAEDIISANDHPFFDNSSVDGYGIKFSNKNDNLKVVGEVSTGQSPRVSLKENEAIRIFTGAAIPKGVDTVVMQEHVKVENGFIRIHDEELKLGGNIRVKGGQLKAKVITLKKGSKITPSGIGFLASIGVFEIKVYKKPSVSILISGNEFLANNEALQPGKIYDSNGVMLQSVLKLNGIKSNFKTVVDQQSILETEIEIELKNSDLVIVTGGVSVGDYDFTKAALKALKFETIFHKVKQKPGKPILFMKRADGKIAFGLPGNPRSAMVGFYIYVLPTLLSLMGSNAIHANTIEFAAKHDIRKKDDGKVHFIAGRIYGNRFEAGTQQASHMLLSMANANAIAILEESQLEVKKGELVNCILI